ncbi:MAG: hypothetical protein C3F11_03290 [Methylocystaceae bacterium]|nr:MAG: hypothetical protein C3F11_03290 [Methylocystaceae bacterium]
MDSKGAREERAMATGFLDRRLPCASGAAAASDTTMWIKRHVFMISSIRSGRASSAAETGITEKNERRMQEPLEKIESLE